MFVRKEVKILKEVKYALQLKLPAKNATPSPPVGTILGPSKINVIKFCNDFNNWSKDKEGEVELGVLVYNDLSYDILSKEQFLQYKSTQLIESLSFLYNDQENATKRR